jgi:hypothetical protein
MAKKPIKSLKLLPEFLQTEKNSKFLSSTIDQLIQPAQLERLDGFIGSKFTPTYKSTSDVYISEVLPLRTRYQLEPALVIKNEVLDVEQIKALDDLINEISIQGGFVNNLNRLFSPEFYSFNPHIDFDKFVNFQKYYWLPTGPATITITGKQLNSSSTYSIVDNELKSAWIFSPDGFTANPVITLYRGNTYNFSINSEYGFYIKTAPTTGSDDIYNIGVQGNGSKNGIVSITVDETTPSTLYYANNTFGFLNGIIVVKQATEDAYINVEEEILGKKSYTSGTGLKLSNGMKIRFEGEVYPESYKGKEYFVEGVGNSISLVEYLLLINSENLSAQFDDDFDVNEFDEYPFDNFKQLPLNPEYVTINRGSKDLNSWSRYNRWVHEDIIITSAQQNNSIPLFPSNKRARRPIIEFRANLQLYNFGSIGTQNIDLIDTDTEDAFSTVEGSSGYHIDGVLLQQGHRIVFNADTDELVKGRIYKVNFVLIDGFYKIELQPAADHIPEIGSVFATNLGQTYAGKSWWFNGTEWIFAQQHTYINQPPLFDLYDKNGISYSSSDYETDFQGSKIFGYEQGTGQPDSVLGFALSYQNTANVGSYKFKNYFNTDIISIFENNQVTTTTTQISYVKFNDNDSYHNSWSESVHYNIPILQIGNYQPETNSVEITAIEDPTSEQFDFDVYINDVKILKENYDTFYAQQKLTVTFTRQPVTIDDNIIIKIYFYKNNLTVDGQYETPLNLTNNPLNGPISSLTLTEISDHFRTMTDRHPEFIGQTFGSNNTRDLPDINKYGTRLISNANSVAFSSFYIPIKEHSLFKSLQFAADQYNQFKFSLYKKISELGDINDPIAALDIILTSINADKDINSSWFHTDMLPYATDRTTRTWTVSDTRNVIYPISDDFDPNKAQYRAVLVYLNNEQLLIDKDYQFLVNDSSIELLCELQKGDQLRVEDYFSTKGSYVPSTPTKLGLYPKYEPKKYLDSSYIEPTYVIQGHDGSIQVAYNDFRDLIILEYEKRIFNNIKTNYRSELFDIHSVLSGAFRTNEYSLDEVNQILSNDFIRWSSFYNVDYIQNTSFDLAEPFTWNYKDSYIEALDMPVNGSWRALYRYFYDTDRPNTHPWEMLGFTVQPDWWEDQYGPVPCTSGNDILWSDLEQGLIRHGDRAGIDILYARPKLSEMIPVDEFGNLVDPNTLITRIQPFNIRQNWKFGDFSPAETSWRKSSYWPFAVQRLLALTKPAKYCSLMYDTSRTQKNIAGQWTYGDNYEFLNLKNTEIHSRNDIITAGYSSYIVEYGLQRTSNYVNQLEDDLKFVDINLFHKVGGFVSKNKLQIVIDALDPSSKSSGAILPPENYQLVLNTSNPIKITNISGIIIQKFQGNFIVKGYDTSYPYFTVLSPKRNSLTPTINVGGISEPFVRWEPSQDGGQTNLTDSETTTSVEPIAGNFYRQGQVVFYEQKYYRVKVSHRAGSTFNINNFQILNRLPIIGGVNVQIANGFFTDEIQIPYGTEYSSIQELYDLIIGYGKWLEKQGFIFDDYNSDLNEIVDFNLSAKEFLYWTTQNWAENSIITLSPFANKIKFTYPYSIVDNIFDNFYQYSILKADGTPFPPKGLDVNRIDGICTIQTIGTTEGIYFAQLSSVQKEHAMVFDNTTIFNDTIYEIETGYRQRRVKLIGFRTKDWNGDYFSPGFLFDTAIVRDWQRYTTYLYGDTVRYNGNYYSAKQNVTASTTFDFNNWVLLNEKPTQDLLPNLEYKINQFEDFYSIDIDNFDAAQQKMAQHLVGYTPRVYMNNIFINPISQYKFYQGFIKEKGTKNSISKMSKASVFNLQGELSYNEEWALRLGQYGSYSSYEELEIGLEEGTFIENPQVINFVNQKPINPIDLIYYSTSTNFFITLEDYNPLETFLTTSTNIFRFPTAGYVSFEDITATAYNENSLLDIANTQAINNGDIFWLGFKSNGDWDILRYTIQTSKIVGVFVNAPGLAITFVTDTFHNLKVGEVIIINNFNDQVNGVYVVRSIPRLNQITVDSTLVTILNEELLSPGLLYKFASARFATFDQLPNDKDMLKAEINSNFWIDNQSVDGSFDWKVYRKFFNYNTKKNLSGITLPNEKFGFSLHKNDKSNVILVGSPGFANIIDTGRVYLFIRQEQGSSRYLSYSLNSGINQYHTSTGITEFGYSVTYNSKQLAGTNFGLLYAGAPAIGNLATTGTTLRYALDVAPIQASTYTGAVKISSIDPIILKDNAEIILVSPINVSYERFGASINVNETTNLLAIGAPGTANTNSGKVYLYQNILPIAKHTVVSTATVGTSLIYIDSTSSIALGQTVWVPGVLNDVLSGFQVSTIYDDSITRYITINSLLPIDIPKNSSIRFYNTSTILSTNNINTSSNGLITTYISSLTAQTPVVGDEFGYNIVSSEDGQFTVISAPGENYVEVFIDIDSNTPIRYQLTATSFTVNSNSRFGESVAISKDAEYLFVGTPFIKNEDDSFGKVSVFVRNGSTFTYSTVISNPVSNAGLFFGQELEINATTSTLAISAIGRNNNVPTVFDSNVTSFDSSSTSFYDVVENFGTVYLYDKIANGSRFVLSAELSPPLNEQLEGTNFGHSIAIDNNTVYVGSPCLSTISTSSFYQYNKIDRNRNNLDIYRSSENVVDIETIQKTRLINTFDETILDYLDIIDPVKGKIAGIAEQEIRYKSAYDPAVYSIGTAGVVVDNDTSWLDEHLGELWWDLSTIKYIWYEQGDLTYRKNNWGSTFPGATIDVYEWVRSSYLPSEWLEIADTNVGLTEGASGQPKYVDNSCISVKQIYNSVSNSFTNVYYFWVKNKVTVPANKNRRISAYQVANIIADPTTYGIRYAAPISKDAVILSNVGPLLIDKRIHLNMAFDTIKNKIPKHTEWALIEEGSATSMPPVLYDKKLFDSLLGKDSLGNIIPDPALSERTRYGISIRPRQTLFKDRKSALRELTEFANSILLENQITDNYSFVNLNKQENPPDEFTGQFDEVVEDNEGLNLIDTRYLRQARLSCSILNGKIESITILDAGFGYKIAPNIIIGDNDTTAELSSEIDSNGSIINVTIRQKGSNFAEVPNLFVRPYSVIVLADNLYNGKWTKFEWNSLNRDWERKQTQKYNTPLYWNYVDWKSSDYNEFVDYTYTVNQVFELDSLEDLIPGQYVKVKNSGKGKYIIVKKSNETLGTFGKGFDLVYSESGTIQISNKIWDSINTDLGFDQNNSFDQTLYDQTPDLELGYILTALKEDLFINELKVNWNLFFFKAVKYALTEQKLLDWAFKTSFINVINYAGQLQQIPVYKFQDATNYEAYLKEVKPYHSQIRTFTASHEVFEPSNSFFTDFDLPSYYNENSNKFETVQSDNPLLLEQPYKAWNDNHLFEVGEIIIGDGGSGYTIPPQVTIVTQPGDSGSGAKAIAYITSGKISKIELTNKGSGYRIAPLVVLTGGGDTELVPAVTYAQLENNKIRTNTIGIKFDRIKKQQILNNEQIVDRFVCDGSANRFTLSWFINDDKTTVSTFLDGDLVLGADFVIEQYEQEYNSYKKSFSDIVFTQFVPSFGQILEVRYYKNIKLFDAVERIIELYHPNIGMPGADLPQLMSGIEYPGTSLQGLPFDYTTDWDVSYSPFGQSVYAEGIDYYTKIEVSAPIVFGTDTVSLSTTSGVAVGQIVNLLSATKFQNTQTLFNTQILNPNKDVKVIAIYTSTNRVKFSSTITQNILSTSTIIISGVENTITTVTNTATVEFWTYSTNSSLLDTVIDGGSWNTTTNTLSGALGVNPEEIIIDGDGFITPFTSYAPEELVPGEAHDSIGINVYTRFNQGAPTVYNGSIDIYANVLTSATLAFIPPNIASIFVSYDNKIFSYVETISSLFQDSEYFTYDWANNKLVVAPQSTQGKLGYTVVSIGGGRENIEAGVLDRDIQVVEDGSTTAELVSFNSTLTVKSAYVSVNGVAIPKLTTVNTSTLGYIFDTSDASPNSAAAKIYNLDPDRVNTVQAWFFGSENKYFNEFYEQIYNVDLSSIVQEFIVDKPPGLIEPAAGNIIVELDTGSGYRRLQPPIISYYEVTDLNVLDYDIDNNISRAPASYSIDLVRVYLNGRELLYAGEWTLNNVSNKISIRPGLLQLNDVIAVLGKPFGSTPAAEFDIQNNILRLTTPITNSILKIITFNNHDDMAVRTETFRGNLNRRFKVSRPISNSNYVWVTVDGIVLRNSLDFHVLDDEITVELSGQWHLTSANSVVITTLLSNPLSETTLGYRIFSDIFNRTHYKRLSKRNTAVLTKPLFFTDSEIHVDDASILTPPLISKKIPGVVLIDRERIEFFEINGNVLKQLRRSTLGTGPSYNLNIGTKVVDQSPDQNIPFNEYLYRQTILITTSTISTFNISAVDYITTATLAGDQISNKGIILSTTSTINPIDQIEVYYGGRKLRKAAIITHNNNFGFDSIEANILGTTATTAELPITQNINDAYIVTATNQIWVYTGSAEENAINGWIYKGLDYNEPEFSITVSINTNTANLYATTASQIVSSTLPVDLLYDIDGDGVITANDVTIYNSLANNNYVGNLNLESNYRNLLVQNITLNIKDGLTENVRLVVTQKVFDSSDFWNNQITDSSTKSILESTTAPALFLQSRPSEIPNQSYYGQVSSLILGSGIALTDENNDPIEGL